MDSKKRSAFSEDTKTNSLEGIGVRVDLDTKQPFKRKERSPGDSVVEHQEMERANEYIADEELRQINENS